MSKEGMCCPISGCPVKMILIYTISVFLTIFLFEWVFHGIYMMPAYEVTMELWRSMEDMESLMHIGIISKIITSVAIAGLYGWVMCGAAHGGKCLKAGAKFGLLVGLALGARDFAAYAYMPMPFDMAVNWLIGGILTGILVGVDLALTAWLFCKKGTCDASGKADEE